MLNQLIFEPVNGFPSATNVVLVVLLGDRVGGVGVVVIIFAIC